MNAFVPSETERGKYADYTVECRSAQRPVSVGQDAAGADVRVFADFFRIPSQRVFRWRPRIGATTAELVVAERWAGRLPLGWWAQFPDAWFKHRFACGPGWYWFQAGGVAIDPEAEVLAQMELQLAEPLKLTLATETEPKTPAERPSGGAR